MKKIIKIIIITTIIIFITNLLYKKIILNENVKILGMGIYIVNSGSMKPEILIGEAVITKTQDTYEVGDIITYAVDEKYFVTHRIVDKNEKEYITKGDYNNTVDVENVNDSDIQGKVVIHSKILGCIIQNIYYIIISLICIYYINRKILNKSEKSEKKAEEI